MTLLWQINSNTEMYNKSEIDALASWWWTWITIYTNAEWNDLNPVLWEGELGFDSTNNVFVIWDWVSTFLELWWIAIEKATVDANYVAYPNGFVNEWEQDAWYEDTFVPTWDEPSDMIFNSTRFRLESEWWVGIQISYEQHMNPYYPIDTVSLSTMSTTSWAFNVAYDIDFNWIWETVGIQSTTSGTFNVAYDTDFNWINETVGVQSTTLQWITITQTFNNSFTEAIWIQSSSDKGVEITYS